MATASSHLIEPKRIKLFSFILYFPQLIQSNLQGIDIDIEKTTKQDCFGKLKPQLFEIIQKKESMMVSPKTAVVVVQMNVQNGECSSSGLAFHI